VSDAKYSYLGFLHQNIKMLENLRVQRSVPVVRDGELQEISIQPHTSFVNLIVSNPIFQTKVED
jgi:hypothetical protein